MFKQYRKLIKTRHHLIAALLLAGFCLQANAGTYQEGREAYIDGDYKRAFQILSPLAKAGNSEAQKMLGIMYDYGQGVKTDHKKALEWYIRSAKQGDPAVQYQVGAKYFRGDNVKQDYKEAAKWWELAANGGQVDAQFNLGLMYFRGLSVPQNDAKAVELFKAAAEQDHGQAQYSLAVMYAFGRGVEKNYATALHWFEKSAKLGLARAQYNLGVFYENGYAVDKDLTVARKWYERAAAQGLTEAKEKLTSLEAAVPEAPEENTAAAANGVDEESQQNTQELASQYHTSEIASTGIKREDWVLRQPPNFYTLQIGSATDEGKLVKFIETNGLEENTAYIEVVIDGVTRYNALFGAYPSYAEAKDAITDLPEPIQKIKPWIRNFGILHRMIQNVK